MDKEEKELSNASDEDFGNLDSSSESSDNESEDESSENDSDSSYQIKNKKKKKKPAKKAKKVPKVRIIMNVSDTQYDVVKYVGKKIFGWKLSYDPESTEWDMFWTDNAVQPETLAKMQTFQKINHFPGMYSLARKNHLGRNLMRMKRAFPNEYKFFPQTFLLPSEYNEFRMQFNTKKKKTFIVKPEASCQGRGIFLTRTFESVQPGEHYVIQRYLHKPFLIDGLKFDMRIYVLLAGCDPLKIFLFDDGLGRFATEEYVAPTAENLEDVCMHLTNYAINKDNPNFVFNESAGADDIGHKRSLKAVFRTLKEQGHDVDTLWKEIKKIIIKTFCSVQPILAHSYKSCHPEDSYNNMCFELLGFDVMLDHKLKPWLIEVNHTPSFTTDTPLDKSIKKNAVKDALRIMNISVENKIRAKNKKRAELQQRVLTGKKVKITPEERQLAFEAAQRERDVWEAKNCGRYTKIYPFDNPAEAEEDYEELMRAANKWWEEWTGTAIKRNVKKGPDPNKPPPMVFGQGPANAGNRSKDIQSIYSQKLKPPMVAKPASGQNSRPIPPNAASNGPVVQETKSDAKTLNKAEKTVQLAEFDNSLGPLDESKDFEENKDFMEHVARITGKESIGLIPEDPGEDYNGPEKLPGRNYYNKRAAPKTSTALAEIEKMEDEKIEAALQSHPGGFMSASYVSAGGSTSGDSKVSGVKGTSFRIKTVHPIKESPAKTPAEKSPTDDKRFLFSRKFAHYMTDQKSDGQQSTPMSETKNNKEREIYNEGSLEREKETYPRKVPLKLSSGIVGGKTSDQLWIGGNELGRVTSFDLDRDLRNGNDLMTIKSSGRSDYNPKYITKKNTMQSAFQQLKITSGNYVAPKLYELNLNSAINSNKEDQMPRPSGNSGGPVSVQGLGVPGRGHGRTFTSNQREPNNSNSNLKYFQDSQASLQRYYNFLMHSKK